MKCISKVLCLNLELRKRNQEQKTLLHKLVLGQYSFLIQIIEVNETEV